MTRFLRYAFPSRTSLTRLLAVACALVLCAGPIAAAEYPPPTSPVQGQPQSPGQPGTLGLIFTNTHNYAFGADPLAVVIKVEVFDNYAGDFTKYHWVYTVTNNSFEPNPGSSNGFSGFETTLPASVPDIGDISAPDGIPPWAINCCSGAPVEWDLSNSAGAPVAGGTLPGQTEVYGFTTLPRLIVQSTGWFHTWETDIQTFIVSYPPGDGVEVPDVLSEPNQELCCHVDAKGSYVCEILPAGQCTAIGGQIVANCDNCPPIVPTKKSSWGKVKHIYR